MENYFEKNITKELFLISEKKKIPLISLIQEYNKIASELYKQSDYPEFFDPEMEDLTLGFTKKHFNLTLETKL